MIFISQPNSTRIVDAIPLFEVEEIFFMHDDSSDFSKAEDISKKDIVETKMDVSDGKIPDAKPRKSGKSNKLKFNNSFQLRTITEGYNSGRQYIIQANSDAESQALVLQIRKMARVSREKFLAKSKFLKAQACSLDRAQTLWRSHV